MGFLDFLFPKQCVSCKSFGSYLCKDCVEKIEYLQTQTCAYCYKGAISGQTHPKCIKRYGLDGVLSFTNYQTPIKEIVKSLKYRFNTDLLEDISAKLKFEIEFPKEVGALLLPIPLAKSRKNYRGFNQAEVLGKIVAKKLGLDYRKDLLERIRQTKTQVGLTKKEREENVKGAFIVRSELREKFVFVFDDVWTSGSTLKEAALVLKKAGAKQVCGLTLAHPH